jgi:hypothetical protein
MRHRADLPAAEHHLPTPDLAPLLAVDDLWVQVTLAPLVM